MLDRQDSSMQMASSAPLCTVRPPAQISICAFTAAHKRAVVRTLMCRAEALSSSGVSRAQEEKLVSQAFQGNGYPKGFIHKHTCPQPDQRTLHDQVAYGSVTLPYICGLSKFNPTCALPHVTTSLSDCPIVFVHACL